ncbi:MAG: hypothetical protein ACOC2W_03810 [bacterium]
MKIYIFRTITEFFNPNRKCERIGHTNIIECNENIRKLSDSVGVIVSDHKAVIKRCKRCGEVLDVEIGEEIDWFNSCSMPEYMWKEMREKGYLILE